jgi:HK97 family phage prohead protease
MEFERRFTGAPGAQVSVGAVGNAGSVIRGYGAVFNLPFVLYEDSGYRVVEVIAPGAFRGVMGNDVRCLFNHEPSRILGRTVNHSLTLVEDSKGLRFQNLMDLTTSTGRNVLSHVKRGDVTGCSFGFVVGKDKWNEVQLSTGVILVTRTLLTIAKLFDVGPVTYPAYQQTSVTT